MIGYSEAVKRVLARCRPLGTEAGTLSTALGYVLAEDVRATTDLPRFDSSAIDGYAFHTDGVSWTSGAPVALRLAGRIAAGSSRMMLVERGTAVRILTGAALPAGVDAVVMQEDTVIRDGQVMIGGPVKQGANIRCRGEEFRRGMKILPQGTMITPAVIGLLATIGRRRVKVFSRPRVAVLVTGDELRPAGRSLPRGGIYDSNSATLVSALRAMGLDAVQIARQKDDPVRLRTALKRMLRGTDLVITTGGVSVGDRDYVKDVLGSMGVQTVFWTITIKPGKPVYFGMYGQKPVFGLPGNPVSVLVSYIQLVRPALLKMMGIRNPGPEIIPVRLGLSLKKKPGRLEFVRAILTRDASGEIVAFPLKGQGSHMAGAMAQADCLLLFPEEKTSMAEGETVLVSLLRWSPL